MKRSRIWSFVRSMGTLCIAFTLVSCGGSGDKDGAANPGTSYPSSYPNAKIIFVTSYGGNGNLKAWEPDCSGRSTGLEAADCICQAYARRGNLSGTYKAWLSDSKTSAASRLAHANVPYVNRRGEVIANNWSELTAGALLCTDKMRYSETGEYMPDKLVWTGTDKSGNIHPLNRHCNDWTSGAAVWGGMCGAIYAVPENFGGCWTEWGWRDCDDYNNCLYCVEQ
jgi:Collagenase NC10 and Endostatin